MRAAFGSDGKAMQVGIAAAGVHSALARGGRREVAVDVTGAAVRQARWGAREPIPTAPAIAANWIKPWPCCLWRTPRSRRARAGAAPAGPIEVVVHPRARQAAPTTT